MLYIYLTVAHLGYFTVIRTSKNCAYEKWKSRVQFNWKSFERWKRKYIKLKYLGYNVYKCYLFFR